MSTVNAQKQSDKANSGVKLVIYISIFVLLVILLWECYNKILEDKCGEYHSSSYLRKHIQKPHLREWIYFGKTERFSGETQQTDRYDRRDAMEEDPLVYPADADRKYRAAALQPRRQHRGRPLCG